MWNWFVATDQRQKERTATLVLVDSHAHLVDPRFDVDRAAAVERARAAGVSELLLVAEASEPKELIASERMVESYDSIYMIAGIHPHEAKRLEESHLEALRRFARHPKVLGIGEIGLDYHYDHSPREIQREALIRQLELARELKLPVIIHCRDAWTDMERIIAEHWGSRGLGGILHCFTGNRENALAFLDWGFLVSFAGNVTFKNAENLRDVAREIPLDRLLTETDCPYLAPVPHRGRRNEPAYVRETTRTLALLRNLTEEELGEQAVGNFRRFFRLA